MLTIPSETGSDSYGETSFSDRDITDPDGRKVSIQSIIDQANSISFAPVLADLGIHIDKYNSTMRCPFHKGGNERSASLNFYADTNQFHCFGCKKHGKVTDFVAMYKHVSRLEAALSIIESHGSLINTTGIPKESEFKNVFNDEAIIEFANEVRRFMNDNNNSEEALAFAEKLCFSFDKINEKHSLSHDGLLSLISKLRVKLGQF